MGCVSYRQLMGAIEREHNKGGLLFAGLNLEGAVVKVSADPNKAYYRKGVSPVDSIVKNAVSNPGSAKLRKEP